jgi:hypothetical protein
MQRVEDDPLVTGARVHVFKSGPGQISQLPTGREQIMVCEALAKRYGGDLWRQIRKTESPGPVFVETSITWMNEYGVKVEVET